MQHEIIQIQVCQPLRAALIHCPLYMCSGHSDYVDPQVVLLPLTSRWSYLLLEEANTLVNNEKITLSLTL